MALRPRNNKGTNAPPTASKSVGENEVAYKQRIGVSLIEQEVVLGQRHAGQKLDPVVQMAEMLKDL